MKQQRDKKGLDLNTYNLDNNPLPNFTHKPKRRPHPNLTREYPLCFESKKQWLSWRESAAMAKDSCTICADCTTLYAYKMHLEGRCERPTKWKYVAPDRNKKKPAPDTTKQDTIEPKHES